ncbi:MAG: DUF167 domain-containing protein [Acidobacteria bacterium]|nr:DUF167 domain-containing protein [Acidobacteriota bacterium]
MIVGSAQGAVLTVRVTPRASRSEVLGARDGALRVRLTAPPVEGAANDALVSLLSECLGVARRTISVISGERGRTKRVLIAGVEPSWLAARLAERLGVADG